MTQINWKERYKLLTKIYHITQDWLTPVEYLPYIDALLGDIDLDPCSTHNANVQYLRAKKIYTPKEDGLNIQDPWTGKVYLFPPTYGSCSFSQQRGTWKWKLSAGNKSRAPSVVWFRRLLREWKLRNVPEALFYTIHPETMRSCPEIWDFPICIPTDRANLVHGRADFVLSTPVYWGYFVYLPPLDLGFNQIDRFTEIFSNLGKIIA